MLSHVVGLTPMQRLEVENSNLTPSRPKWITSDKWLQCQHLEASFPRLRLLCRSIITNHTQWDTFAAADDPYEYLGKPYVRPDGDPETTGKVSEKSQISVIKV